MLCWGCGTPRRALTHYFWAQGGIYWIYGEGLADEVEMLLHDHVVSNASVA
jgi:hypothetical protein